MLLRSAYCLVHPAGDSPVRGNVAQATKGLPSAAGDRKPAKGFGISIGNARVKGKGCYKAALSFYVVHPAGVEPATFAVGGRHSIQLRYGCILVRLAASKTRPRKTNALRKAKPFF